MFSVQTRYQGADNSGIEMSHSAYLLLVLLAFVIPTQETDAFLLARIRSDEELVHLGHANWRALWNGEAGK